MPPSRPSARAAPATSHVHLFDTRFGAPVRGREGGTAGVDDAFAQRVTAEALDVARGAAAGQDVRIGGGRPSPATASPQGSSTTSTTGVTPLTSTRR